MISIQPSLGQLDYIECLFVSDATEARPSAIPGSSVHSVESALIHMALRLEQGLSHWLVVAVNETPSLALAGAPHFCVTRLLQEARRRWGEDVTLIADVGLSPYQSSGQSVVLREGRIAIEDSYAAAAELACCFAAAGADAVAPCLSLPHQTGAIRQALERRGLRAALIPYSTKFSSSLYGPYRQAIGSRLGLTRKSYQFDYDDAATALNQLECDIAQGAVATIVKPAMPYLDVLAEACRRSSQPVAVYHVSGEYSMAVLAAQAGLLDLADYLAEIHAAFRRCGARWVIGYAADAFLAPGPG
jgi:porphobilinogen synthase